MEFTLEGTTASGRVLDLRERRVDRDALVAAVRGEPSRYEIDCPAPGPLHRRVGVVTPDACVRPRTALAAAARSRGLSAPDDERVRTLRAERDDVVVPSAPSAPEAPPVDDVTRLRERVAALRGEVRATESAGTDPTEARSRLRAAAGRLAELETERAARRQASQHLRAVRDARERRLRIEDELANAERAARAHLVDELRPEFAAAVADLTDDAGFTDDADPFDAPPDAMALAIARLGDLAAPVVLAVDRFESPDAAADWLDAPVIRL